MHQESKIKNTIKKQIDSHPDKSGVMVLSDGYDAFSARTMLADNAVSTLDIQYYIWENDLTGTLMFEAVYRAAERGVRVRLLLDDNKTGGMDRKLAALHTHPLIEIRLFNPLKNRRWRLLGNFLDFHRLNRRMHNKAFTADNQATVIGGRNIGDEYFNAGQDFLFIDLDILAVGPVVTEVSRVFERFWDSAMTIPVDRVVKDELSHENLSRPDSIQEDTKQSVRAYREALQKSMFSGNEPDLAFEWGRVVLVSDDPEKITESSSGQIHLPQRLRNVIDMPVKELLLVVPYFVPGKEGAGFFVRLRKKKVQVTILTNAFESTDVAIIHAGYIKYRKKLLKNGVKLFELKRSSSEQTEIGKKLTGSSAISLHAKTFCIDRSQLFIGSCNFDPRSSMLNTEMGVLIECPPLAQKVADTFSRSIPENTYEVQLDKNGKLLWADRTNGSETLHGKEPGMDMMHRIWVYLASKMPIEWLL